MQHVVRGGLTGDVDGQALAGELVDDGEHAKAPAVVGAVGNEVVGPDVVRPTRAQTHEPSFSHNRPRLGCFLGTFSPSWRQIRSTRLWFTRQPA